LFVYYIPKTPAHLCSSSAPYTAELQAEVNKLNVLHNTQYIVL